MTYLMEVRPRFLGEPLPASESCDTAPANSMTFAQILATIRCELLRRFKSPDDPALLTRRVRLRELFNAVPPPKAKDLHDQLRLTSDPLAQLFRSRLATPTRKELIGILFFADYDLRFEPRSTTSGVPANPRMTAAQKAQRITDVNTMVSDLLLRRDKRATHALSGTVPPIVPATGPLRVVAERLSTAQLDIFREFFPFASSGINLADFQHSFEQFANGQLRDPTVRGKREPNGAFFFLFAEFAFVCVHSGIDAVIWTQLLRVFVQTQEIFMHIYRPAPHRPPPPANAAPPSPGIRVRELITFSDSNFNRVGQSNAARKAALRSKYAGTDVNALRMAARDNLLRAQRMP